MARDMEKAIWFEGRQAPESTCGGSGVSGSDLENRESRDVVDPTTFAEARERVYEQLFGPVAETVKDPTNDPVSVHVNVYPPGFGDRTFYTLVTSGMSDLPMKTPEKLGSDARRAELVLYADQPGPSLVRLIWTLAKMPHQAGIWLGHGHSLPNGDPPSALFPDSVLNTILLIWTVVAPERNVRELLVLDGDPLQFLLPFPISGPECEEKLQHGLQVLLDRFNENQLSFVFDPGRPSVI